jgi:hypothetical protein
MKKIINANIFLLISFFCVSCNGSEYERLLKSSKEDEVAQGAKYIVDQNKTGPMVAYLLIDALKRAKSSKTKLYLISALKINYERAFPAVPTLIQYLKDQNQEVVCNTADLLGTLTYNSNKAVPALLDTLEKNKGNLKVRLHIIKALGEIGPRAKSAIPVLKENLKDPDHLIIIETRNSLYHILQKQSIAFPNDIMSVGGSKVKKLPEGLTTIYFNQDKSQRITALFEGKKFPDRSTFYIYLRNNIPNLKNKKFLIEIKGKIPDLSVGAIIKLLLDNDIPVYGKTIYYDKVTYSPPYKKF